MTTESVAYPKHIMTVRELITKLMEVDDFDRKVIIESEGPLVSTCRDDGIHAFLLFGDGNA